jgi:hypothetical protein
MWDSSKIDLGNAETERKYLSVETVRRCAKASRGATAPLMPASFFFNSTYCAAHPFNITEH